MYVKTIRSRKYGYTKELAIGIKLNPRGNPKTGASIFTQRVTAMDELTRFLVQVLIAMVCAFIANILIPRAVPGKLVGLILIGFAGVFIGEWISTYLLAQYSLDVPALQWEFKDVPILPSIIGSMIVLYVITAFLSWGRYGNR